MFESVFVSYKFVTGLNTSNTSLRLFQGRILLYDDYQLLVESVNPWYIRLSIR